MRGKVSVDIGFLVFLRIVKELVFLFKQVDAHVTFSNFNVVYKSLYLVNYSSVVQQLVNSKLN